MTYNVDPAGVKTVLTDVATTSQPVMDALGQIDGAVQSVATAAQSELVNGALTRFFDAMSGHVTTITRHVPAAIDGAVAATNAVVHGDDDIAATMERNAGIAAADGDLSILGVDQ
ncbi:DUF6507 family protein [Curtobacterium sp. VKM Ac-2922]|uniref:DUF6507 family protein n=1 Tax=Curtobacterium sp. VKM Ac-2922 TaxID=2929475 RepID=UPI001FB3CED2|nr:DUF6507 family protein [Curtobacterium sp. VKM Ac-2922]MCJ1713882.1 DUF6507 family protein [Curtobacterium sp. VKM Ac-2922]